MDNKIRKKYAEKMSNILKDYVNDESENSKLILGLNNYLVQKAWDTVSGAKDYTINRFFKEGKLYITLNSSLVRTQLNFQREDLRKSINKVLFEDEICKSYHNDTNTVKELIIK